MRRGSYVRASLHDPYEEGALVLHIPPEMSAHEQLTADRYSIIIVLYRRPNRLEPLRLLFWITSACKELVLSLLVHLP